MGLPYAIAKAQGLTWANVLQMELTEQLSSRLSKRVATSAAPNGLASSASGRLPRGAPARPGLASHGSYSNLAADSGAQRCVSIHSLLHQPPEELSL